MPGLELKYELGISEARRFIRSLPRTPVKQPSFIAQSGRSLRMSLREKPGAIRLAGLNRIRIIEPLLSSAKGMRVWSDSDTGVSGWEFLFDVGRLFLLISPELYRGFSGEGQVLERLATGGWEESLSHVQAQLAWQSQLDISDLSSQTGFNEEDVASSMAVLGSRGLAGYDVATGKYFHRILPFELDKVEQMQPRLKGAKKLLEDKRVKISEKISDEEFDLQVGGSGVDHLVRIRNDQDKCTCPWFCKYLGQRGPCKHILAARMYIGEGEQES